MKCKKDEIGLEASIWFQKAQNKFLGGDRIALLEKIDELGSINSAAKAVGISYITDSDSFRCAVDRAKLIDFFKQGDSVAAQKLVLCFLKPDRGFKPYFIFFAFHYALLKLSIIKTFR